MAPESASQFVTEKVNPVDAADFPGPLQGARENLPDWMPRTRSIAPCLPERGFPHHRIRSDSHRGAQQSPEVARDRFHQLSNPNSLRGTPILSTRSDFPDP